MSVVLTQELANKIRTIFIPAGNLHRTYLLEQIPQRKLANAKSRYAQALGNDESVILLYDDTVWGSGKDGFLLTTRRIYGRNIADSSSFVEIRDIENITLGRSGFVTSMHVQSASGLALEKHISMSAQEKQAETLIRVILQTVGLLKSELAPAETNQATDNPQLTKTICNGCGATVQVGTVCKFCRRLAQ